MILESLTTLKVKHKGKNIVWPKGCRLDWSEEAAMKLLMRAPEKVRRVDPVQAGEFVQFRSRLFGLCYGKLAFVHEGSAVIEDYSVTGGTVTIPLSWLIENRQGGHCENRAQ